ncbi:hypothetical protein BDF20DRAFT_910565 [Mycotypha africana]|uniref:uncharacterized protein n=1 Tax=Mycotypha africana TaxID=64632 RepID=UPI0023012211|nr:uncharacterized protein BDF20DRAFT_910565 [Mycotypha africana]KAI8988018.1 hypothetical protein BDF20DRAFT_910565 [Mycotypha africana]
MIVPAVRLASGVEPQQKWPAMSDNDAPSSAKANTNEGIKLIELNPTHGNEGTIVTVVVQALPPHIPAKLAFNSLMVDTKQLQAQGITSLVATVPSFQQTHSPSPNVPISICFLDKDMVTETWIVADFVYDLQPPQPQHDESNKFNKDSSAASTTTHTTITPSYHQPLHYDKHHAAAPSTASTAADSFQSKGNNDFLNSSAAAYQNFYSSPAVNSPYGFGTQIPNYQQYAYQQQSPRDVFVDKYAQQGRPQQQHQQQQQQHQAPPPPPPTQYSGYNNSALHLFPSAGAGGFTSMLAGGLDQQTAAAAAHNAAAANAPTTAAAGHTNMIPPMTSTYVHHHHHPQQQQAPPPSSLPSVSQSHHQQQHQQQQYPPQPQHQHQPPPPTPATPSLHLSQHQHPSSSSSSTAATAHPTTSSRRHNNASGAGGGGGGGAIFGFKSTTHTPTTSVANYQPYPGLVSRANLDIMGDLDSMTKSWTNEEWDHRRRLVQFWREQHGNKITTHFQPVPQGERASNSGNIVVSCIYWMERNDFFITSVDCIYLLECLMDIRFSVEEKNRIRRNLEGFRPMTVSKCKVDSADFFKLIMSFPNPKPRNIEKDVKVFPWKTLPYALKKIVTKYTASSYNSVPPPLIPTAFQQQQQQQQQHVSSSNGIKTSVVSTPTTLLPPTTPTTATPSTMTTSTRHPTMNAVTAAEHPSTSTTMPAVAAVTAATTTTTSMPSAMTAQSSSTDPFYPQQHHNTYQAQPYSQELYGTSYYNQQQQEHPPTNNAAPPPPPTTTTTTNTTTATTDTTTKTTIESSNSDDHTTATTNNPNTMHSNTSIHPTAADESSAHVEATNMHPSSDHDLPSLKTELNLAPLMTHHESHTPYSSHPNNEPTN